MKKTSVISALTVLALLCAVWIWLCFTERSNSKNLGITWFAARFILCHTNPERIKEFLPLINTNGTYKGYSIAWGVEISKLVNIKIVYYKYTKKPEIDYYLPIYQFSFNYSIK